MPRRSAVYTAVGVALVLSVIGIALIYSASHRIYGVELAVKQTIWLVLGTATALFINQFSREWLYHATWPFYGIGVALLVATLLFGITIRGDQSWLDLGLFHLQSSEIMKLFLVMALARVSQYYASGELSRRITLCVLLILFIVPFVLIMAQPDLGTALVYLLLFVGWMFIGGFWSEGTTLAAGMVAGVAGVFVVLRSPLGVGSYLKEIPGTQPLSGLLIVGAVTCLVSAGTYYWRKRVGLVSGSLLTSLAFLLGTRIPPFLEGYQKQRLLTYLDPYQSPLDSGYNIIQAQIAIGSGGWFGQGYLQGTQSQLGFIPELWTDFIFSVAIEELGLVFGGGLLVAFLIYVYCYYSVSTLAADWEAYYLSAGMGLVAMIHVILNISVCVGLIPVVGLPLPFLSYGGSFLVSNWIMIGILTIVSRRLSGQALLKSPPKRKRYG